MRLSSGQVASLKIRTVFFENHPVQGERTDGREKTCRSIGVPVNYPNVAAIRNHNMVILSYILIRALFMKNINI
jgi:hypothetical protein